MVTNYNRGYCAWCAEPADDWVEDSRGNRLWVCNKQTCQINIERELREEMWKDEKKYYLE